MSLTIPANSTLILRSSRGRCSLHHGRTATERDQDGGWLLLAYTRKFRPLRRREADPIAHSPATTMPSVPGSGTEDAVSGLMVKRS